MSLRHRHHAQCSRILGLAFRQRGHHAAGIPMIPPVASMQSQSSPPGRLRHTIHMHTSLRSCMRLQICPREDSQRPVPRQAAGLLPSPQSEFAHARVLRGVYSPTLRIAQVSINFPLRYYLNTGPACSARSDRQPASARSAQLDHADPSTAHGIRYRSHRFAVGSTPPALPWQCNGEMLPPGTHGPNTATPRAVQHQGPRMRSRQLAINHQATSHGRPGPYKERTAYTEGRPMFCTMDHRSQSDSLAPPAGRLGPLISCIGCSHLRQQGSLRSSSCRNFHRDPYRAGLHP